MLFERWDKSRSIHVPAPIAAIEAHIRPGMMYLAHWIYTNDGLQEGVTEGALVSKATDYLSQRRYEDRDEAEKAARDFIEFCRGRAWVFTDWGTTKEGERLYKFTHRTFLEYFTAYHLVRTHETSDQLVNVLRPRIEKGEWDVVAQLSCQIKNKNSDEAGDKMLTRLIQRAASINNEKGRKLLSFVARSLTFMNPSPRIIREATELCVERCIAWGVESTTRSHRISRTEKDEHVSRLIGDLVSNPAPEIHTIIADSLTQTLSREFAQDEGDDVRAYISLAIGIHLMQFLRDVDSKSRQDEPLQKFWEGVSHQIYDLSSARRPQLYPNDLWVCVQSYRQGDLTICEIFKWHGMNGLFSISVSPILAYHIVSPVHWLFLSVFSDQLFHEERVNSYLQDIKDLSQIFLSTKSPWVIESDLYVPFLSWIEKVPEKIKEILHQYAHCSDVFFAMFVVLAVQIENSSAHGRATLVSDIQNIELCTDIAQLIEARFERIQRDKLDDTLSRVNFSDIQQEFVKQWVQREMDFTTKSRRAK
jgi:hypothetical protein